jgi:hypothetical protein
MKFKIMFILANSLCVLAEDYEIKILKDSIAFYPKKGQCDKEFKSLVAYFTLNGFETNFISGKSLHDHIGVSIKIKALPASALENEGCPSQPLPELRLMDILAPRKTVFDTKMKAGDVFIGTYDEYSIYHGVKYFIDDSETIHSFSYAQIIKHDFKKGSMYEIRCLGMDKKSKRNPYPANQFEIIRISV